MIKVENVKNEMYNYYVIYWNDKELLRFVESSTYENQWDCYSEEIKIKNDYIIAENFEYALFYFKNAILSYYSNYLKNIELIISELRDSIYD